MKQKDLKQSFFMYIIQPPKYELVLISLGVFSPISVVMQDKLMFIVSGSCPSPQNKKF